MVNRMLTAFVLVALFSHSISEQENFMVCKNIRNVFTDAEDSRSRIQVDRSQGPPGKKGAPGARGLPGIPGRRGAPAKVNYDQISAMIEERVREGTFSSMVYRFINWQTVRRKSGKQKLCFRSQEGRCKFRSVEERSHISVQRLTR